MMGNSITKYDNTKGSLEKKTHTLKGGGGRA